jgi:hypothetical protein
MEDFNCKGTYTKCFICDDICDSKTRKECKIMARTRRPAKKDAVKSDPKETKKIAAKDDAKAPEAEIAVEADLSGAATLSALAVFEEKKHKSIPIVVIFLTAIDGYNLTLDQKPTYLKFLREPDSKVIFYLYLSRKVQIEVKAKAGDLEAIKELIIKESANTFIELKTEEDATAAGEALMAYFEVSLIGEEEEEEEEEKPEKTKGGKKKEEPEEEKEESEEEPEKEDETNQAQMILIAENIVGALEAGDLEEDDLEDEETLLDFLEDQEIDVPDEIDIVEAAGVIYKKYEEAKAAKKTKRGKKK